VERLSYSTGNLLNLAYRMNSFEGCLKRIFILSDSSCQKPSKKYSASYGVCYILLIRQKFNYGIKIHFRKGLKISFSEQGLEN
jgi:hypothetical protein